MSSFRSLLVGHFCENNAFFILLSWMPTYFHESFPTAKVKNNFIKRKMYNQCFFKTYNSFFFIIILYWTWNAVNKVKLFVFQAFSAVYWEVAIKFLCVFQGWVFNVVPWVVTIPSSIGSGWIADKMITKGDIAPLICL